MALTLLHSARSDHDGWGDDEDDIKMTNRLPAQLTGPLPRGGVPAPAKRNTGKQKEELSMVR